MERPPVSSRVFELIKWYADCISDDGEVLIGYSGQLRYRQFAIQYESVLTPKSVSHSLGRSCITADKAGLVWNAPGLDLCGRWERRGGGIRETVYQSPQGAVEWDCVAPKAAASIDRHQHARFSGWGYAERLRLTITPWRLPIRTLRWGRYLSKRNSLIWIDWQGEFSTRIVYWNGRRVSADAIENGTVTLSDGTRSVLDCSLVVRQGKLGSTLLHVVPGLAKIAPSRIFLIDECKWRSRARLETPGEEADEGWCIHEEVTWP